MKDLFALNQRKVGKKPVGGYEIDWSNDLTKGLWQSLDLVNSFARDSVLVDDFVFSDLAMQVYTYHGMSIDHSKGEYVTIPGHQFTTFSVEALFTVGGIYYQPISIVADYPGANYRSRSLWTNATNKLEFTVSGEYVQSSFSLINGKTYHAIVTCDLATNTLLMYIDGLHVGTKVFSGGLDTGMSSPELVLGKGSVGSAGSNKDMSSDSTLYLHRVYNRVIHASEAKRLSEDPRQFLIPVINLQDAVNAALFSSAESQTVTFTESIKLLDGVSFNQTEATAFIEAVNTLEGISFSQELTTNFSESVDALAGVDFLQEQTTTFSEGINSLDGVNFTQTVTENISFSESINLLEGVSFTQSKTNTFTESNYSLDGVSFLQEQSVNFSEDTSPLLGIDFTTSVTEQVSFSEAVNILTGVDFSQLQTVNLAESIYPLAGVSFSQTQYSTFTESVNALSGIEFYSKVTVNLSESTNLLFGIEFNPIQSGSVTFTESVNPLIGVEFTPAQEESITFIEAVSPLAGVSFNSINGIIFSPATNSLNGLSFNQQEHLSFTESIDLLEGISFSGGGTVLFNESVDPLIGIEYSVDLTIPFIESVYPLVGIPFSFGEVFKDRVQATVYMSQELRGYTSISRALNKDVTITKQLHSGVVI